LPHYYTNHQRYKKGQDLRLRQYGHLLQEQVLEASHPDPSPLLNTFSPLLHPLLALLNILGDLELECWSGVEDRARRGKRGEG